MIFQENEENTLEEKNRDKRLYSIGDMTRTGSKISGIYDSSINYILFWNANGGLCWEIDKISDNANNVLLAAKRIRTLAGSVLTQNRISVINDMLADIISESLRTNDLKSTEALFKEVESYIEKYKDEILSVVSRGPRFKIYRVKGDLIQWHHSKLHESLRKPAEDFNALQSLATSALPKSQRKAVSRLLSASLSNAFRQEVIQDNVDLFEKPRVFIYSQIESYLKIKIFCVSLLTTIIMLILFLCGYLYFDRGLIYFSGASAGVLGTMISSLQRNNEISIDPYISYRGLYSEAISRIFIGIVFGLFIVFCANSELALAPFKENIYALVCFAFIAGFSERFVPDLMSAVASNVKSNE
ncbi:hypothetical protein [Psychrobacter sp. P11G5]|uniref:hypothetical protein n=1 Tax=Psychrobacter sp. P11G5 TaxID=1699624 RepID=UPI00078D633D|nr:hypothetical protein [Psychrobacter sp. P11G5]AMN68131.1 hypothetical protein AK825_10805 [Psychrobacter sp. P11G5]